MSKSNHNHEPNPLRKKQLNPSPSSAIPPNFRFPTEIPAATPASNHNQQKQFNRSTFNFNDSQFNSIFVRTVVTMDPDSDLFMQVAQRAYQEHENSLVPCSKCGRTFFPERIESHERSCAASRLISTNQTKTQTKQKMLNNYCNTTNLKKSNNNKSMTVTDVTSRNQDQPSKQLVEIKTDTKHLKGKGTQDRRQQAQAIPSSTTSKVSASVTRFQKSSTAPLHPDLSSISTIKKIEAANKR